MARVIQFIDDFSFWNSQVLFFRSFNQRNPGYKLAHEALQGLKRVIKAEQRAYRREFGEIFSFKNVDSRSLIKFIWQSWYKPNSWEYGFLNGAYVQEFQLTKTQKKCLEKIYLKVYE